MPAKLKRSDIDLNDFNIFVSKVATQNDQGVLRVFPKDPTSTKYYSQLIDFKFWTIFTPSRYGKHEDLLSLETKVRQSIKRAIFDRVDSNDLYAFRRIKPSGISPNNLRENIKGCAMDNALGIRPDEEDDFDFDFDFDFDTSEPITDMPSFKEDAPSEDDFNFEEFEEAKADQPAVTVADDDDFLFEEPIVDNRKDLDFSEFEIEEVENKKSNTMNSVAQFANEIQRFLGEIDDIKQKVLNAEGSNGQLAALEDVIETGEFLKEMIADLRKATDLFETAHITMIELEAHATQMLAQSIRDELDRSNW